MHSFILGHLLKKQPETRHLTNWLNDMKNKWQDLGRQLGVSHIDIQTIEIHTRPSNQLSELFDIWRRRACSPYTFENLLKCLDTLEEKDCYERVMTELSKFSEYP